MQHQVQPWRDLYLPQDVEQHAAQANLEHQGETKRAPCHAAAASS
jgi:hypothetical protein